MKNEKKIVQCWHIIYEKVLYKISSLFAEQKNVIDLKSKKFNSATNVTLEYFNMLIRNMTSPTIFILGTGACFDLTLNYQISDSLQFQDNI